MTEKHALVAICPNFNSLKFLRNFYSMKMWGWDFFRLFEDHTYLTQLAHSWPNCQLGHWYIWDYKDGTLGHYRPHRWTTGTLQTTHKWKTETLHTTHMKHCDMKYYIYGTLLHYRLNRWNTVTLQITQMRFQDSTDHTQMEHWGMTGQIDDTIKLYRLHRWKPETIKTTQMKHWDNTYQTDGTLWNYRWPDRKLRHYRLPR